ncbi:hypothetical protein [Nostoc sp.]|uniref:hypothetical protein n=1 Tax=Nostoc sp. TaxID=1180 RepID=UPI003FA5900D
MCNIPNSHLNRIVSRNNRIVSRNNRIVSRNNRIVSRNNRIVSRNNRIVSRNNRIVSRNNRIVSQNKAIATPKDLCVKCSACGKEIKRSQCSILPSLRDAPRSRSVPFAERPVGKERR